MGTKTRVFAATVAALAAAAAGAWFANPVYWGRYLAVAAKGGSGDVDSYSPTEPVAGDHDGFLPVAPENESNQCSRTAHLRAPLRGAETAAAGGATSLAGSTSRTSRCLLLSMPPTGDITMRANWSLAARSTRPTVATISPDG